MSLSDTILNSTPTFQRAKTLGVRTLPLVPMKDDRPRAFALTALAFLVFFVPLLAGLGIMMGVGR